MASFGETLKRERELRDTSLREIAVATKINIRFLEALEQNHFDRLPGGVFNKFFMRAYASYIGVDDQMMVDQYLEETLGRGPRAGAMPEGHDPALHRPVEVPRRRAGTADLEHPSSRQASSSPELEARTVPATPAATEVARAVQALYTTPGSARETRREGAVTRLLWLVAGAGLVFIALFIAARYVTPPLAEPPPERSSSEEVGTDDPRARTALAGVAISRTENHLAICPPEDGVANGRA